MIVYIPPHFLQEDQTVLLEVMQRYSFATLVSKVNGAPFATHLPVSTRLDAGVVRISGHVARANPHWKALEADPQALVIFHGPHTYISPTLYQSTNRVPTWNYIAVHASGQATVDHTAEAKLDLLSTLIADHEPAYRTQFDAIDPTLRDGLVNAIVAIDITIEKLEGKFKLGQHRLADDKPEMQTRHEHGGENEREIAEWMKRLGYWP
jgi:transcriptional regulator